MSTTLAWGWAVICKRDGAEYFNDDGYHVPEDVTVRAGAEFMANSRRAELIHDGQRAGTVIHAFPLTADIAKAMGIVSNQTGLLVGIAFDDPAILAKFERGELRGFSPSWTGFSIPTGA